MISAANACGAAAARARGSSATTAGRASVLGGLAPWREKEITRGASE